MKTCRRRAGGNFHLRAALDHVGTLTVFGGENATQWTALLPAQERLLTGGAQQLRLDPRPELCFYAFQVPLQRRPGGRNRLRVRLRCRHSGAGARRRSSHGDGWCRGLGRKGLFRSATGSLCPCLLPCQCVRVRARARVCVRCLFFGALPLFQKFQNFQKIILPEITAGILVLVSTF